MVAYLGLHELLYEILLEKGECYKELANHSHRIFTKILSNIFWICLTLNELKH